MHLIFGCGYLGERVIQLLETRGERVAAVTRNANRAAQWERAGRTAVVADVTQPGTLANLPAADVVIWAVGFDRNAGPAMPDVYVSGLRNVIGALRAQSPRRFVYISSTSVYGNPPASAIGSVDEATPCLPTRANGKTCLEAEQVLRASPLGETSLILRLAGIYGPGRLPNLSRLQAGEPIPAEPEHRLNLIHVEDAAAAVVAAMNGQLPSPDVFNIADGHPPTRREFYEEAARLWEAPPPVFAPPKESDSRRGTSSDRRIDNGKMLRKLLPRLRFSDFRAGLAAVLEAKESS